MTTHPTNYEEVIKLLMDNKYGISIHTNYGKGEPYVTLVSVGVAPIFCWEKEKELRELVGDRFLVSGSSNHGDIYIELRK